MGNVYGAADLTSLKPARVAQGFLRYLDILWVLKNRRDHSRLNVRTPVLTGGIAVYETVDGPLPAGEDAQVVSADATIDVLRAHGLEALVDAYAIHVYPRGNALGDPVAAADRKAKLAAYALNRCSLAGSTDGKPCRLTEWVNNPDRDCPIDDRGRTSLVRDMMGVPSVRPGPTIAGTSVYAWNDVPGVSPVSPLTLFRCDALTPAGQAAVDASLVE